MNAKYVVVRDGIEEEGETVADHEALYVDGKRVWVGAVDDHEELLESAKAHGATEDDLKTCNLGPKDVQMIMDNLQFPDQLSDFTDTEIPPADGCGCGPSCKGCASKGDTDPNNPLQNPAPRPERKVAFKPNDPDAFFEYDEQEYQLVLERLRRYAEDWPEKRDDLLEKIAKMDPEKEGALGPVLSATSGWVQLTLLRKWAKEVMDQTEKDGKDENAAVDENGHKVNDQECPFLFFNLQLQRRGLAKTLIDSTRHGAQGADFSGLINNEALAAMSIFIDDFVHIAPSLRKVDLGNKDPLVNTL